MKRFVLLIGFFTTTPIFILSIMFFILFLSQEKGAGVLGLVVNQGTPIAYAALPSNLNTVSDYIDQEDGRVGKVTAFLASFNSPLTQYASLIVAEADRYGIDYRLLPAIGAQESGDCTNGKSMEWKNCWGFGIYGKHVTTFDSYEQAIDTITQYFANKKSVGADTLDQIGSFYNPSDYHNWKANVASFMSQL